METEPELGALHFRALVEATNEGIVSADSSGQVVSCELEEMTLEARAGAERVREIVRGLRSFSRAIRIDPWPSISSP